MSLFAVNKLMYDIFPRELEINVSVTPTSQCFTRSVCPLLTVSFSEIVSSIFTVLYEHVIVQTKTAFLGHQATDHALRAFDTVLDGVHNASLDFDIARYFNYPNLIVPK